MNNGERKLKSFNIFTQLIDIIRNNGGILIALAIMIIAMIFGSEHFLSGMNLQNLFSYFTTNCILGFCMMVCLITGEIDLSISSLIALSGIILCLLLNAGVPFLLCMLIVLATGAVVGLFTGLVIAYTGMASFIVTLAMQGVIRGLAYIVSAGKPVNSSETNFFNLANGFVGDIPIPTIILLVLAVALALFLSRTIFGKHMYATGGNREAAVYSGIKVKKVVSITFSISGLMACLAGALVASRVTSGQPTSGTGYEGDAVAAAVLGGTAFTGGRGTVVGVILGALVIGIMSNGLNLLQVSYYWQLVCKGLIIMLAVEVDTLKQKRTA